MATRTWIGTTSGDWSVTTNWVEGSVPANGDDVVIKNNAVAISAGLAQSAVTLATLTIDSTYTGTIGTASAYLAIGATLVTIGGASGSSSSSTGSSRIKINFGSVQTTCTVLATGSAATADSGLENVRFLGTHASNKYYILGGRVGIATTLTSETSTVSELDVSGQSTVVNLGPGVTTTTINQTGGSVNVAAAATLVTISQSGGTITTTGTFAVTTAGIGGTANLNSTGTVATLNLYGTGTADFSGNPASRTVTTLNHYRGGTLKLSPASPAHVTLSTYNKIQGGTLVLS